MVPNVLMLVIYNPSPLYDAQRDFWRRYMNSSPNIFCYFITFCDVPAITLDGDILRIPGEESYEGIIDKTLKSLEYFLERKTYDFVIRTNISSIWDYQQLNQYLLSLPRTGLYCGLPGGTRGSMSWVSGSGILLTPDTCRTLLDARELALSFKIIDDVDIGYTFEKLGVPITIGSRHDIYNASIEIPEGFYHYRVRLLPKPENLIEDTIECMDRVKQMNSTIRKVFLEKCRIESDINEHLPVLMRYASKCSSIVECGVRQPTSSYAFATGLLGMKDNQYTLIDPFESTSMDTFLALCKSEGVNASFIKQSDLECPLINTDLLFIDTWHIYGHLKREFARWNGVVKKYIILHDTTTDEIYGETLRNGWNAVEQSQSSGIPVDEITRGLGPAITEFLNEHPEWQIEQKLTNNNGLTILRRIS
jgi:hypothetical protein